MSKFGSKAGFNRNQLGFDYGGGFSGGSGGNTIPISTIVFDFNFTTQSVGAWSVPATFTFSRNSSASVQTSDTTVNLSINPNVPRIGQRTSSSLDRGLVIEETRTNSWLFSRDMNAGTSSLLAGAVVTINFENGPDGTLRSDRVQLNAGNASWKAIAGDGNWAHSIWTKRPEVSGTSGWAAIRSANAGQDINSTQFITTSWTRLSLFPVSGVVGNTNYYLADTRVIANTPIDNVVDMVQTERGGFPTEYISSSATPIVRADERFSIANISSSMLDNGRIAVQFSFTPKGTYAQHFVSSSYIWFIDNNNYARITTGSTVPRTRTEVVIGGSQVYFPSATFAFEINTKTDIFLAVGGDQPTRAAYRVAESDWIGLPTGSNVGNLVFTGSIDIFCSSSKSQISSWIHRITTYKSTYNQATASFHGGGLLTRFNASAGITLTGSGISSWADQSGNGWHAAQTTDSRRPFFSASSANFNGHPVVNFNAANIQKFDINNSKTDAGFCIVAAIKPNNTNTNTSTVLSFGNPIYAGSPFSCPGLFGLQGAKPIYKVFSDGAWRWISGSSNSITAGTSVIVSIRHNLNGAIDVRTNGVVQATASFPYSSGTYTLIGESQNSDYFDGDIAEIFTYNFNLSSEEISQTERYLGNKFNISIT